MIAAKRSDERRAGAGVWAVVPVKRLAAAKQRLAAVLGEAARNSRYLLACRTLDVVTRHGLFEASSW